MIEEHYGQTNVLAEELDAMISNAETRNLTGTLSARKRNVVSAKAKEPAVPGSSVRAGDRGRTGDVQLGKLAFYR